MKGGAPLKLAAISRGISPRTLLRHRDGKVNQKMFDWVNIGNLSGAACTVAKINGGLLQKIFAIVLIRNLT